MRHSCSFWSQVAVRVCAVMSCTVFSIAILSIAILSPTLSQASKKKQLAAVRWAAGAPGCTLERPDGGHFRWTMADPQLTVSVLVDSQELAQSRHRFYNLFA